VREFGTILIIVGLILFITAEFPPWLVKVLGILIVIIGLLMVLVPDKANKTLAKLSPFDKKSRKH
jgi:membrane-bound ClpP family serine protease